MWNVYAPANGDSTLRLVRWLEGSRWADLTVIANSYRRRKFAELMTDKRIYGMCLCGYVLYDIPRDTDEAHDEMCVYAFTDAAVIKTGVTVDDDDE